MTVRCKNLLDNQQKTITKQRRIKAEKIFKQSIVNQSLANATFDSYEIDEKTQPQLAKAKRICKYADNFNLDNKQSLLIQGTFGTGNRTYL